MMMTRYDKLSAERRQLTDMIFVNAEDLSRRQTRVNEIDHAIRKLMRKRHADRARREMLFDLNGHHGRA